MIKSCAFTGHRNLNGTDFDASLLDRIVLDLIKTGTKRFYCGMALGFDLQAAHSVLIYKEKYGIQLIACLPCSNQSDTFPPSGKKIYDDILNKCDEKIVLSSDYYSGCMHYRDRYMVDRSDTVVCFLRKNKGGTFYTVNYAKKLGKKIIEI